MFRDFEIENFRAFKFLRLPELKRVNLIVGKNGSGKTCLLEAVSLYAEGLAPEAVKRVLGEHDLVERAAAGFSYDRLAHDPETRKPGGLQFRLGPSNPESKWGYTCLQRPDDIPGDLAQGPADSIRRHMLDNRGFRAIIRGSLGRAPNAALRLRGITRT
ncbi:MAG: AAA family ATPase [Candidatus Eremiobacterota bacterium]